MTSSNNSLMKPYAKRLAIEAFIKAIMAGLFFGLSLALVVAFISRLVRRAHPHSCLWWVIGATVGGIIVATVMGIITYKKRFKSNTQKLARRIDALGLQQRVTTMVEFSNDKSYVAKVQREDAIDKVAKLDTKQLHIRVPLINIIICSVMFIITVLLFLLNVKAAPDPIDKVDIPDKYQEQIDELRDYVAEQAEVLRENYPESIEYIDMFEERLNVQIDELVREIKTDIYNAEKDEQSQKELNKHIQGRIDRETEDIEEKVEAEFEIREMIRDIHHIIDYSGAPKDFQEFLYTIVDALELRLAESETLTEKYKDIKETREYILELLKKLEPPIEEIIEEELLRELGEAIDFYKNPVPDQDGNMPTKVEKEEKIDTAVLHIYEDLIGRSLDDRAERAQAYSEALERVLTAFEESELKEVEELIGNLLLQEAFRHFADGTHGIYVAENNYQDTDVMTQQVTDLAAEEIKKALEELENMEQAMEEIIEEMEEMEEQLNEDMNTMDEMIEQMEQTVEESNVDEETKEELQQEIQELQQQIEEIFENYEEKLQEDITQEEKEQAEQEMKEQLQEAISEMKEKLQEELQQEQEEIDQMEESEEKEEAEENHEEREETTDELTEIMEQAQRELDDAPEPPPEEEQQEQQEEQQAQEEQQETEEQQESENSGPSQNKVNNEEKVYDPINNEIVPLKNLMTPEYKQTVLEKLADPALSDADRTFLQAYISSLPWDNAE